tara:strand:+ start:2427 stop:2582 length:156 start_codon:yes stop_codon:yes gene_type:complete
MKKDRKELFNIEVSDLKRNEQLFCSKCETAFEYDWHVEYNNCPKCGCDVAK